MILKLPQLSNLNSFKDLCSGDAEVDFFKNIIHLQVIFFCNIILWLAYVFVDSRSNVENYLNILVLYVITEYLKNYLNIHVML